MFERSVEEGWLGEHGNRGCPTGLVLPRDGDRVVVLGQHAFRRRTTLAFGNDVGNPGESKGLFERVASR